MTAADPANAITQLVVFVLDDRRFAIRLDAVERVVRMVEVRPFPKAPAIVSGVIDVQGELVPVLNMRRRFGLPERPGQARDQLMVARSRRRRVALVVDAVEDVIERASAEQVAPGTVVPGLEYLSGVTRLEPHGLILIHDLDAFLSLEEKKSLDAAAT